MLRKRPNAETCRCRTILLWMAGCFVAAQVLAGLAFDHLWPQVRFPFLYRQLARLEVLPAPPSVVFLGSSRLGCCVLEEDLNGWLQASAGPNTAALNAGVPLGDFLTAEHTLDLLLQRGTVPRLVILEICPEALHRTNRWLKHHVERHLRWEDGLALWQELRDQEQLGAYLEGRLVPLLAHRKGFFNFLGRACSDLVRLRRRREDWIRTLGFVARPTPEARAEKARAGLAHARELLADYAPGGCSCAALERILTRCRERSIQVLLLAVPVSSEHRRLYAEPAGAGEGGGTIDDLFLRKVAALQARHGCAFLDCRTWIADGDFLDNHHAATAGAAAFTRRLYDEVLSDRGRLPPVRLVGNHPSRNE